MISHLVQVLSEDDVDIRYGITATSILISATATLAIVFGSKVSIIIFYICQLESVNYDLGARQISCGNSTNKGPLVADILKKRPPYGNTLKK